MGVSGNAAIAVEWAAFAVSLPFVGLRFCARYQAGRLGASDLIVLFTWLTFLAKTICDNELWRRGVYQEGISWRDDWSGAITDPDSRVIVTKVGFAVYFPYILELWGVKFALIALYYNFITFQSPRLRLALHCVTAYTAITLAISIALKLLQCVPISDNWATDPSVRGHCADRTVPYLIPVVFHISSDFALCAIPFPFLRFWRIKLSRRQRICLISLLIVGGASVAVSIGRFVVRSGDAHITTLAVWTAIEMNLGLLVVCWAAVVALNSSRMRRRGSIPLPPGNNDATDSGREEETIKSWFSVRSRSASKTSDNMFRGSADHLGLDLDLELDIAMHKPHRPQSQPQPPPPPPPPPQVPAQTHRRGSRRGSHSSRFLSRFSQSSREASSQSIKEPENSYDSTSPLSSTPPGGGFGGRKLSQDRAYPQSEFRVEESLRQNNGNVQESVMALRDDILRSISFAYDEQVYNHDHHTHAQPRKGSKDAGWR
ncbi:hypothetical protein DRE_04652 [Drechslerella stenobrocha 248]|uniref:Rhodopsin domain-containing protein n=1 Tax=Drechslerella stenobrocha 248 TaxID=1043628 RepID=W7I1I3_9PEZI|nr:hypothetical protein DRE_04652 [Drechslerella stenobrocha 248]